MATSTITITFILSLCFRYYMKKKNNVETILQ